MFSMKFDPWIPRMEFNTFIIKLHQVTSLVEGVVKVEEGAKIQEGRSFSCSLV
jgi:hypothetical protein